MDKTILTKKYLKSVKDKLVTVPLMWIDRDYPVELEWYECQGQDTSGRLEMWVYYNGSLMCRIDNVEQLEAMYFGVFGKKITELSNENK